MLLDIFAGTHPAVVALMGFLDRHPLVAMALSLAAFLACGLCVD